MICGTSLPLCYASRASIDFFPSRTDAADECGNIAGHSRSPRLDPGFNAHQSPGLPLRQRDEQRLCFLQVSGVEPLGERTVDRRQQLPRLLAPPVVA
jgi:hypothetical protein